MHILDGIPIVGDPCDDEVVADPRAHVRGRIALCIPGVTKQRVDAVIPLDRIAKLGASQCVHVGEGLALDGFRAVQVLEIRKPDANLILRVSVSVKQDHLDPSDLGLQFLVEGIGRFEERNRTDIERRAQRLMHPPLGSDRQQRAGKGGPDRKDRADDAGIVDQIIHETVVSEDLDRAGLDIRFGNAQSFRTEGMIRVAVRVDDRLDRFVGELSELRHHLTAESIVLSRRNR